jgi:hypothetical protein
METWLCFCVFSASSGDHRAGHARFAANHQKQGRQFKWNRMSHL